MTVGGAEATSCFWVYSASIAALTERDGSRYLHQKPFQLCLQNNTLIFDYSTDVFQIIALRVTHLFIYFPIPGLF